MLIIIFLPWSVIISRIKIFEKIFHFFEDIMTEIKEEHRETTEWRVKNKVVKRTALRITVMKLGGTSKIKLKKIIIIWILIVNNIDF